MKQRRYDLVKREHRNGAAQKTDQEPASEIFLCHHDGRPAMPVPMRCRRNALRISVRSVRYSRTKRAARQWTPPFVPLHMACGTNYSACRPAATEFTAVVVFVLSAQGFPVLCCGSPCPPPSI